MNGAAAGRWTELREEGDGGGGGGGGGGPSGGGSGSGVRGGAGRVAPAPPQREPEPTPEPSPSRPGFRRSAVRSKLSSREELGYELWQAARDGDKDGVAQALEKGAPVDYKHKPGDYKHKKCDAFEYKNRPTISEPIHVAAFRQGDADVPQNGRWRDKKKRERFGGAVVRISPSGWLLEQARAPTSSTYKRCKRDRYVFVELKDGRIVRRYVMFLLPSGELSVEADDGEPPFRLKPADGSTAPPAAVGAASQDIVKLLLEANAQSNSPLDIPGPTHRKCFPIHLAAAAGNVGTIRLLFEHNADLDEPAIIADTVKHYMPIHDATWFNRVRSVKCLLDLRADVTKENSDGWTALHLAARLGHVHLCYLLMDHVRDSCSESSDTPLDLALKYGRFPCKHLHIFVEELNNTQRSKCFLEVGKLYPSAAAGLLRSQASKQWKLEIDNDSSSEDEGPYSSAPLGRKWCNALREGAQDGTIEPKTLAILIREAPQAACDLLEALIAVPVEQNETRHPLPIRAQVPAKDGPWPVGFAYKEAFEWGWQDPTKKANWERLTRCSVLGWSPGALFRRGGQPWHDRFVKEDAIRGNEVCIRIVHLKGLADMQVFHELALTADRRIFAKLAIHALLNFAWCRLRPLHILEFLHSVLALAAISVWILGYTEPMAHILRCMLWSLVASSGCLQLVAFGWSVFYDGHLWGLRGAVWRCASLGTWLRLVFGATTLALAGIADGGLWPTGPLCNSLLAANSVLHWVNLLLQLRAYSWVGQRLLPMLRALGPISSMLSILASLAFGFMSAFWAMDADNASEVLLFKVVALLLTGEQMYEGGELEAMGNSQRLALITLTLAALFIFLACALNIFIAYIGDCYDYEMERIVFSFQKERAKICSELLSGFSTSPLRGVPVSGAKSAAVFALSAGALLWIGACFAAASSLQEPGGGDPAFVLPAWGSALILTFTIAFCLALIRDGRTQGWDAKYLWLCYQASMEAECASMIVDTSGAMANQGRMQRIKQFMFENRRLSRIENRHLSTQCEELWRCLQRVEATQETQSNLIQELLSRCELQESITAVGTPPASQGAQWSARKRNSPVSLSTAAGSTGGDGLPAEEPATPMVFMQGFTGTLKPLNGVYKPLPRLHAGRPCWHSVSKSQFYLFHSGKARWVISNRLDDGAKCLAYAADGGAPSPARAPGPWRVSAADGSWSDLAGLRCGEGPALE